MRPQEYQALIARMNKPKKEFVKLAKVSHLETMFLDLWENFPTQIKLEREVRFCERKWRFDFVHMETKTAIEIDGGTGWRVAGKNARGGHVSPLGYERDREKDMSATLLGWTVFRLTSSMVTTENVNSIRNFILGKIASEKLDAK